MLGEDYGVSQNAGVGWESAWQANEQQSFTVDRSDVGQLIAEEPGGPMSAQVMVPLNGPQLPGIEQ